MVDKSKLYEIYTACICDSYREGAQHLDRLPYTVGLSNLAKF